MKKLILLFMLIVTTFVSCNKNGPVIADFMKSNSGPANIGVPVIFINNSTGDIKECVWDFDDGTIIITKARKKEITHTFTDTRRRSVSLTVSNDQYSDTKIMSLDVM